MQTNVWKIQLIVLLDSVIFKNAALDLKKGVECNQNKAADIDMSGYVPKEY